MPIAYYYTPLGSSTRVTWALEELGVAYEKHRLLLKEKQHKTPEFLAMSVVMASNMAQLPAPARVSAWAAKCQARPAFGRVMTQAFGG